MYPKIGGSPLGMNSSAPLKTFLAALRRAAGLLPVLALLLLCLAVAPVQQFMGRRPSLAADDAPIDASQSLPGPEEFASLCRTDPVRALEMSLLRYEREVTEYSCTMVKRERIKGKLHGEEVIACAFREKPFSVLMKWQSGIGQASGSLFVEGENHNAILVLPAGKLLSRLGPVSLMPDNPQVLETSRYTVGEFGIERGMRRTFTAWSAVRDRDRLRCEYLGVQCVKEVGGRRCHVIKRFCDPPEEDGMTELTIMLDEETWLQVGSELKAGDQLIGHYYFRDIDTKPNFIPGQFLPKALER